MLPATSSESVERNWQLGETLTFFQKGTTLLKICATCLLVRKPLYWIASHFFPALEENYNVWHREWHTGKRVIVMNSSNTTPQAYRVDSIAGDVVGNADKKATQSNTGLTAFLTPAERAKAKNPEYASMIDAVTADPGYAKLNSERQEALFSRVDLHRLLQIKNGNYCKIYSDRVTLEDAISQELVQTHYHQPDNETTKSIENILLQKFSDEEDVQEVRDGIGRIKAECLRNNLVIETMLRRYSRVIDLIKIKCETDNLKPTSYIKFYGNLQELRSYKITKITCLEPLERKIKELTESKMKDLIVKYIVPATLIGSVIGSAIGSAGLVTSIGQKHNSDFMTIFAGTTLIQYIVSSFFIDRLPQLLSTRFMPADGAQVNS